MEINHMDAYFALQAQPSLMYRDIDLLRRRVIHDSQRLFKDTIDIEITTISHNDHAEQQRSHRIRSVHELVACWDELRSLESDTIYVLRQDFSWDYLCLDRESLFKILSKHRVFPEVLDCIHSFGLKINDDDEVWEGCHNTVQATPADDGTLTGYYELCYNFRYVTLNGRAQGTSWSLRQTTVYQKVDIETGSATWILIQPAKSVKERFLKSQEKGSTSVDLRMRLHLLFLHAATEEWKGYIAHLRGTLEELDEKATFSRVEKTHPGDYDLSFKDGQRIQKIRQKLFRSMNVLEGSFRIAERIRKHCDELTEHGILQEPKQLRRGLEDVAVTLKYHKDVVSSLLAYSSGTAALLQKIPEYRAVTELRQSTRALENSLFLLRGIATSTQTESENLCKLAEQGTKDSTRVKILTQIMTLYLPPTLIATIFSSNLITSQNAKGHLVISPQFWVYALVTICFTLLTIAGLLLVERRRDRAKSL